MKNLSTAFIFLTYFSLFGSHKTTQSEEFNFLTFTESVNQLPPIATAFGQYKPSFVPLAEFKKTVDQFRYKQDTLLTKQSWVNTNPFLKITTHSFKPFAQKLIVPNGSQVAFFGDLHGNVHALCALLHTLITDGYLDSNLQITKNNFYMIFLGDYVDRGLYGVEVIYLLLKLYLANPDRIILVRGNHEDRDLNAAMGFEQELKSKFGSFSTHFVYQIYDFMPCVLYLGTQSGEFAQCCHGGLEAGFNARQLLAHKKPIAYQSIEKLERKRAIQKLTPSIKLQLLKHIPTHEICDFIPQKPTMPLTLGFLWHDFVEQGNDPIQYNAERGWKYGKDVTEQLLLQQNTDTAKICGVFRAHQHYGHMLEMLKNHKGIFSLWDGIVYTFLSAPLAGTDFSYASCGIVTTAHSFADWTLKHIAVKL